MQAHFLIELIDKASQAAGNDNRLAQKLEVNRQTVSAWRHGKKPCPAGDVALMADLIGMDAEAWLARATVAQYAGTAKGERLARVLGKALLVTGAVIGSAGAHAAVTLSYFIRCIKLLSKSKPSAPAF